MMKHEQSLDGVKLPVLIYFPYIPIRNPYTYVVFTVVK